MSFIIDEYPNDYTKLYIYNNKAEKIFEDHGHAIEISTDSGTIVEKNYDQMVENDDIALSYYLAKYELKEVNGAFEKILLSIEALSNKNSHS